LGVSSFTGVAYENFYYLITLLLLLNFNVYAEIYKWVDKEGNAHFSQNINDVPKDHEVKEVEVKASNSSQSNNNKRISKSSDIKKNKTSKYAYQQLEQKCDKLARKFALNTNGFNTPEYREYRRLKCGSAAMERLRNSL
jgi:hypothetical protein